jgi:hypothetical protein
MIRGKEIHHLSKLLPASSQIIVPDFIQVGFFRFAIQRITFGVYDLFSARDDRPTVSDATICESVILGDAYAVRSRIDLDDLEIHGPHSPSHLEYIT